MGEGKVGVDALRGEFGHDIGTQSQVGSLGADFSAFFLPPGDWPLRGPSGGVGGAFAKGRAPNKGKYRQTKMGTKNPARVRSGTGVKLEHSADKTMRRLGSDGTGSYIGYLSYGTQG